MTWGPKVGDRVELRPEWRIVRHLRRVCPDLEGQAILGGTVVALDPRGTARVLLDPPDQFWYLWVAFQDLAPEPGPPDPLP